MTKKTLVIDSSELTDFFLAIEEGVLTLGNPPADAQIMVRNLHITGIHIEIEVEDEVVVVSDASGTEDQQAASQTLRPGEALDLGSAQLRLETGDVPAETEDVPAPMEQDLPGLADEGSSNPAALSPAPPPAAAPSPTLRHQLRVIDGADQGRTYVLPETGVVTLGKSDKYAEIVLHDLYVARVHCALNVQGAKVIVTHNEGDHGTLINGKRITQPQELQLGEVLRIGNSHLRLELAAEESHAESIPDVAEIEVLDEEAPAEIEEVEVLDDENAAPQPEPVATPRPALAQLQQLEGQVLGHYQIGPILGRGHVGMVFRAHHVKTNAEVALKVLTAEFPASAAELERFVRAFKVTPLPHHPNLVTLVGAGKSGPYCWIAREYVDGESLADMIERLAAEDGFDWKHAARLAVHLARAASSLHEHKFVLGSLTPRNILIRARDQQTKLADLMLFEAIEESKLHLIILEEKLLADMPYLAPEQADPDAFVDHLADLYVVGAMAYTLLTGRPPFTGNSPEDILAQVREATVVKPTELQPGIPAAFESVVLKLLAKRQEDRYQTAAELLANLEAIARAHKIRV